ncbi:protein translocase subunit SecF [Patescibacteria group bacterium]
MLQIIDKRKYAYIVSAVLVAISIALIFSIGLKPGIDFKGGTLMEVQFSEGDGEEKAVIPTNEGVRAGLAELNLSDLIIQSSENNSFILRYIESDEKTNEGVVEKLKELNQNMTQKRVDFIGSSISGQIKKNAIIAVIVAVIGVALYIAWAFRKVSYPVPSSEYGMGAIVALAHDLILTLGIFVLLGKFLGVEVGIPFIAALLTILGYSVNDTIVVYDRIRENLMRSGNKVDFEKIVNKSLNETLARSINTSLTVVAVLLAIVFFGGESIKYFSVALLAGVIFGTYSSVFVASALLVSSYNYKKNN